MPTVFTAGSFNTWSACIPPHHHVVDEIVKMAHNTVVLGLQEVHKRGDARDKATRYQQPKQPGSRPGPVDIELYNELHARLKRTHHIYFVSHFLNALHDCEASPHLIEYGNVLLIKRDWKIMAYTTLTVSGRNNLNAEHDLQPIGIPASRSAHIVTITNHHQKISVMNVHGLWSKRGKKDIPARTVQSSRIATLARRHFAKLGERTSLVLLGDFNYTSEMEAYQSLVTNTELFGPAGGVCLNAKFGKTDTRTQWYPEDKPTRQADFMCVDPEIADRCKLFEVHQDVSSDHALLKGYFYYP